MQTAPIGFHFWFAASRDCISRLPFDRTCRFPRDVEF
jgi:hypothetical protein